MELGCFQKGIGIGVVSVKCVGSPQMSGAISAVGVPRVVVVL